MTRLLPILLTTACVANEPVPYCMTVSSERIGVNEPMPELDGASVGEWFDQYADSLSWDITWTGLGAETLDDTLTLMLERSGRPTLEEERALRPDTPDTPDALAGRCHTGLFIRVPVDVLVTTDSGIEADGEGELVLLGPELSSAQLGVIATGTVPDVLQPTGEDLSCPASNEAAFTIDADGALDTPTGAVGSQSVTCGETWAQWTTRAR